MNADSLSRLVEGEMESTSLPPVCRQDQGGGGGGGGDVRRLQQQEGAKPPNMGRLQTVWQTV